MSAGKATPGPIRQAAMSPEVLCATHQDGHALSFATVTSAWERREADAERMVACWNFLDGEISTAAINAGAMRYRQLSAIAVNMTAERDAALARVAALEIELAMVRAELKLARAALSRGAK